MSTYTVKSGDTLSGIARKHNTTVHALMQLNKIIKDKNKISVGWVLTLPSGSPVQQTGKPEIAEQVEKVLAAVKALPEFVELERMIYGNKN